MPDITEEEADALSELVLSNPPKVDPSKARIRKSIFASDNDPADFLLSISEANQKGGTQEIE